MSDPFAGTSLRPGRGHVVLGHIPPHSSTLKQVSYQYPLKLVAPSPLTASDRIAVQTVYLLTYGGGIVAGDEIDLEMTLEHDTRLVLLTQGSTKVFKSPSADVLSLQKMTVDVRAGAFLCYLPDPVQPFERSAFEQRQVYNVDMVPDDPAASGSICVLDWVSRGRSARGEDWGMWRYISRNDVWLVSPRGESGGRERALSIRDNLILDKAGTKAEAWHGGYADRMYGIGVFATLILHGPRCRSLSDYFHAEFKLIPRIGGRQWDAPDEALKPSTAEVKRTARQQQEREDELIWTVASLRGCTVVKFGARDVEGGKRWLRWMLEDEGSVVALCGERALLCQR